MSRTLSVSCSAIPVVFGRPVLEPVRLCGEEGVDGLFAYELWLSGAAELELDDFVGREICCEIELDGAAPRQINALITDAALWGEQGRHVQYKLKLRPWLHLATLRTDCRIFQNQTVVQILDALLANYGFPVDKRLAESYPLRDYQTQFNESDFQFFSRLCQEWGISYHFEHSQGRHRLVLSDAMGAFMPADGAAYSEVEYHAPGWKLDAEYVHSFVPAHQLTSGRYAARDYDYIRPRADLSSSRKDPRPTGHADGEVYQWHAETGGSHFVQPDAGSAGNNDPKAEGDLLAMLRMQALRTHGARAQASGNLRGMVAGRTFRLQKHPRESANAEYLVLATRFLIENVAQESQGKENAEEKQQWRVSVDFTSHPVTEPLRPALTQPKPRAGGCQVAVVVGPAGENIWTDALGRIKVQFPWDRLGGNDAHSSCWLRVSSPWAGNQLGGIHIPRIGQEVIVDFISGDPDLPICTGRVHNQANLPPWALPGQSALSGFRSRELTKDGGGNGAAGRSNHLLMDDTEGRIQAQLKSDHQSSSLSLGSITRVEDNAGRKEARGEGFELRTDGHGVLRAQDGLLITTEARPDAARHAKDMGETIARLNAASALQKGLADAAATATAQAHDEDQAAVAKALGSQAGAIKGSDTETSRSRFPELEKPQLVLASAAGVAATTSGSLHLQAGEHIAVSSEGHASISAGKRLLVSAKDGIRLFALKSGMNWIAGNGKVQIEAHRDKIDLTARKAVRITSTTSEIRISAPVKVVVNGGGSFTEWSDGGILHGTSGGWVEHAASHVKAGPASAPLTPQTYKGCSASDSKAVAGGAGVI
ncbi:type VI secretion system tip protein TssI/VgrG [Variovorax sp. J22G73]|uniref:type VI secretion system Vgr family protein n=1 Tax=unclassified Variovorax TaxID=663243 RepID=UPI00257598D3|nr:MULTISPECIES: type VI secretion system Vgr family protein [unclassified Variovorax]MDM0009300.1 type VI secretion system tip protein TssI/VgrG [Variovorax sp. J22R203]MDM0101764.1 type VI secretion system tip protein TssI/VgrG [Variovorax sp. J22G73]